MEAHIRSSTGFQVHSEARDAANAHKTPLFPFVFNTEKAYNLFQDRTSNVETLLKIRDTRQRCKTMSQISGVTSADLMAAVKKLCFLGSQCSQSASPDGFF